MQPPSLKRSLVLPVYCLSISGLIRFLSRQSFFQLAPLPRLVCLFVSLFFHLHLRLCVDLAVRSTVVTRLGLVSTTSPPSPCLCGSLSPAHLSISLSQTSLSFAPLASPGYLLLSVSLGAGDSSVSPPSLPVPLSAQTSGGFCVSPSTAAFPYFSVTSQPYPWPFHLQDARLLLRATLCFGLT